MPAAPANAERPRRARLSVSERETQLLDIAEKLFTERGFDGVTIEDIARAAQVTRPVVYQRYGSKESVFIACVRRAREHCDRMVFDRVAAAPDNIAARIKAGCAAYCDIITTDPRRFNLLFTTSANLDGTLAEELRYLRQGSINSTVETVRPYVPELSDEALTAFAYAVSGIGEQLGRWLLANPKMSRKKFVAYYTAAIEGVANSILAMPQAARRRRGGRTHRP
ncbi:TetR/AcrR family transcriptional regulator [Nocardia sp. NPDC056611]|uniref:TetR/AcrR family transcriptional regulator n=1 Tax=Nocardia sp. NPDC056611 TaxID=3345877 RepID=UPI00366C3CDE